MKIGCLTRAANFFVVHTLLLSEKKVRIIEADSLTKNKQYAQFL
jgi:hypothetical protein